MQWYATQVANHPSLLVLLVFIVAGTCLIISMTTNDLPSFKDPLLGFEPRGTILAQRAAAWTNLMESSTWNGPLSMFPGLSKLSKTRSRIPLNSNNIRSGNFSAHSSALRQPESSLDAVNLTWDNETSSNAERNAGNWVVLENAENNLGRLWTMEKTKSTVQKVNNLWGKGLTEQQNQMPSHEQEFFCSDPSRAYSHLVFHSKEGKNFLNLQSLLSLCRIEDDQLQRSPHYTDLCEYNARRQKCCRSWSLPNYIALLNGRRSCHLIVESDVEAFFELLKSCSHYYHSLKLSHDCSTDPALCRGVPRHCTEHNAVYNVLHYLTDIQFLSPETLALNQTKLTYTNVFLPIAQSTAAMDYYKDLNVEKLTDGEISVAGMQFGLKHALFDEYLIHDTTYVGLAGCIIFVFIWMYTTSIVVTFMTFLAVVFSLAMAYFVYTTIFKITFFPFMNLLTVVIAIGIGADDAFIYCKIWVCAKAEKNNGTLIKLVRDTLHHACLSMFVTSITTAAAFFGSFISSITAVRCFSIFSGTAVLANFLFTVTCLPASIIISERCCASACCLCIPPFGIFLPPFQRIKCCSALCNAFWKLHYSFIDTARVFFEKILPCLIIRPRYVWVGFFTAIALGSSIAVFYYPKLRLPDSKDFQIFSSDHPFERYDLVLKKQFSFEKSKDQDYYHKLPIRVVWGVVPVDNGNYLNPFDRGSLILDHSFSMSSPEAQTWLLSFCKQLRNQSFYQSTLGPLLPNCFIETLKSWMERRCVDGITKTNRTPCCETSKFPYSAKVFNLCLKEGIAVMHRSPGYYFIPGVAGPRFSLETGEIKAIVIEYDSIFTYSNSYSDMNQFETEVETWVQKMMATAPKGMENGWFSSELDFYDLQDSLARGTLVAIGVAIGVSFVALLITTLNLLISLYAIVTIACIIVVTVGCLVLLGWKLNILESTTVSVAIGLAVDFTLHYGVAYRLSSQEDRESSVIYATSRIGSPVAMGAFTTFMAGAFMFPSSVLAYLQIGTFLVLVMTVSWLYATFFFQSLLSLIGPQNGQLQLHCPSVRCNRCCCFCCCLYDYDPSVAVPIDKPAYALSESTLSTSSASYHVTQIPINETHELEPLTNPKGANSGISSISEMLKYPKKKAHVVRTFKQRSGSLSSSLSRKHDPSFLFMNQAVGKGSRKVSLPTVNVTFHGDPSPPEVFDENSCSTIVGLEEEDDSLHTRAQSMLDNHQGGSQGATSGYARGQKE